MHCISRDAEIREMTPMLEDHPKVYLLILGAVMRAEDQVSSTRLVRSNRYWSTDPCRRTKASITSSALSVKAFNATTSRGIAKPFISHRATDSKKTVRPAPTRTRCQTLINLVISRDVHSKPHRPQVRAFHRRPLSLDVSLPKEDSALDRRHL